MNDHFERVKKQDAPAIPFGTLTAKAVSPVTSKPSVNYHLTLQTKISRSGSSNPYKYTAKTSGVWDTSVSTLLDGKKKPAFGDDYVLQACPAVVSSSSFSSRYNYTTKGKRDGQEGANYSQADGGNCWIEYKVDDDPLGIAQLESFNITQVFKAKSTKATKKINSYYVHTWASLSIRASATATPGVSGGNPAVNVGLSISPTIKEKQWQLYNYVSYNW